MSDGLLCRALSSALQSLFYHSRRTLLSGDSRDPALVGRVEPRAVGGGRVVNAWGGRRGLPYTLETDCATFSIANYAAESTKLRTHSALRNSALEACRS